MNIKNLNIPKSVKSNREHSSFQKTKSINLANIAMHKRDSHETLDNFRRTGAAVSEIFALQLV